MAIRPLPQSTIYLLGSTQVLTTPTSLIKELIDNSIDAKSTSIDVLISPNALDKIEVRDNGHGILKEDLNALGKRGHTSKLRTFDELKKIGGTTLGFRGEALASAAQLGDVSVTTKTEGEEVATSVKLKIQGGLEKQSLTSHPVGTTVTVVNFLSSLPVRRQNALKEAPKVSARVKELVQTYALARPQIRFSVKISKHGRGSWSFAPRPNDGIREAVARVVGIEAAAQCEMQSLLFSATNPSRESCCQNRSADQKSDEPSESSFQVELYLPKPDADYSKVAHGQYLSIDSRPVAHDKGIMRRIVNIFRSCVLSSTVGSHEKPKNPFLRMNIMCPTASYDPNVEPAKDDVLFENENLVLESLDKFFKTYYGACNSSNISLANFPHDTGYDFELLLARKPSFIPTIYVNQSPIKTSHCASLSQTASAPGKIDDDEVDGDDYEATNPMASRWNIDMSSNQNEELDCFSRDQKKQWQPQTPRTSSSSPTRKIVNSDFAPKIKVPVNPWSKCDVVMSSASSNTTSKIDSSHNTSNFMKSIISPKLGVTEDDDRTSMILFASTPSVCTNQIEVPVLEHITVKSKSTVSKSSDGLLLEPANSIPSTSQTRLNSNSNNDFIRARHFNGTQSTPVTSASGKVCPTQEGQDQRTQTPFILPSCKAKVCLPRDALRQTKLSRASQSSTTGSAENPELLWAMDYEHRKTSLNQRYRMDPQSAQSASEGESAICQETFLSRSTRNMPHQNRYNTAVARLAPPRSPCDLDPESKSSTFDEVDGNKMDTFTADGHRDAREKTRYLTSLPYHDPRAYLIRCQNAIFRSPSQLVRVQSNRLPLEGTHKNEGVHIFIQHARNIELSELVKACHEMSKWDEYIRGGVYRDVFKRKNDHEAEELEKKIKIVVQQKRRIEIEWCFDDLKKVIKGALEFHYDAAT